MFLAKRVQALQVIQPRAVFTTYMHATSVDGPEIFVESFKISQPGDLTGRRIELGFHYTARQSESDAAK
jgi:hypothetical protein